MLFEKARKAFPTRPGHANSSPRSCRVLLRFSQQLTARVMAVTGIRSWRPARASVSFRACKQGAFAFREGCFGPSQTIRAAEEPAGHRHQLRMPGLGIVAIFSSKGSAHRGCAVVLSAQCRRAARELNCSETPAQHRECGDWGCSGCSPSPSSIPEL